MGKILSLVLLLGGGRHAMGCCGDLMWGLDGCIPQLSSAGSFHWESSGVHIVEKVDTGKQKQTHLGIFLICIKTEKKWWTLLQPSTLLHHITVEELTTGNGFCCCGLPLPDLAVCFEYRAQVFSSDVEHCKYVRGIFLRGKNAKEGLHLWRINFVFEAYWYC